MIYKLTEEFWETILFWMTIKEKLQDFLFKACSKIFKIRLRSSSVCQNFIYKKNIFSKQK